MHACWVLRVCELRFIQINAKWIITCCVCCCIATNYLSNIIIFYTFLCLISYFLLLFFFFLLHFLYLKHRYWVTHISFIVLWTRFPYRNPLVFCRLKSVEGGICTHEPNGIIKLLVFLCWIVWIWWKCFVNVLRSTKTHVE